MIRAARARLVWFACGVVLGCAGDGKRVGTGSEEAPPARDSGQAAAGDKSADAPGETGASAPGGLRVEVRWPEAGPALRAPAGRGPCGRPRRAPVVVHTLGGVADAVVELRAPAGVVVPAASGPDGAAGESGGDGEYSGFTIGACGPAPRVIATRVQGEELEACNHDQARHLVRVAPVSENAGQGRAIPLAMVGACSRLPVDTTGVFRVTTDADPDEPAYAFVSGEARVQVTNARGMAVFRELPAGVYQVRVWYPPLGPAPAVDHSPERSHEVTVRAGATAELRVDLAGS